MIAALPLISSVLGALAPATPTVADAGRAAATAGGEDFGQMMSRLAADTVHNVKGAETAAVDGIAGKADVQAVVQSVMSAQEALQTALAIRDKAVAAFQEVTRMAI